VTESPLTRLARALLLATAAVVLVGLVAVSASGYRIAGSSSSQTSPYAVDTIVSVLLALYLVGAIVVFVALFWAGLDVRRAQKPAANRQRTFRMVAGAIIVAVGLAIAAGRFHFFFHPPKPHLTSAQQAIENARRAKGGSSTTHQTQVRLAPFLLVIGAAAIAFAGLLLAERGRGRRLPGESLPSDELAGVLDETLDDLLAEPDPRRAVIAAYARMERAFAAHGVPRRQFEAPHEYLGRVLAEATGGGRGAARLTALFERARFSPHEVDSAMKNDAIEAIQALQAELAAAEAEEAA
jgi:membrane protease YdiL (CAAX protease family)